MTTRRDAFKLAAAAAATMAPGQEPAAAAALAPFSDVTAPAAAILDGIDTGSLCEMVCIRCAQAKAEYEAAFKAVVALDPDHFARFLHPVTLLDEAALGLYLTGIDEGLRLGLAAGMGEGIRLHLAAYRAEFPDAD